MVFGRRRHLRIIEDRIAGYEQQLKNDKESIAALFDKPIKEWTGNDRNLLYGLNMHKYFVELELMGLKRRLY